MPVERPNLHNTTRRSGTESTNIRLRGHFRAGEIEGLATQGLELHNRLLLCLLLSADAELHERVGQLFLGPRPEAQEDVHVVFRSLQIQQTFGAPRECPKRYPPKPLGAFGGISWGTPA